MIGYSLLELADIIDREYSYYLGLSPMALHSEEEKNGSKN